MANITLAGLGSIHTDAEGRYSLNDFHELAGGEDRHQPSLFLQNKQTQELIEDISNSRNSLSCDAVAKKAGRYGGTYAVKKLVYAYANWVSPSFYSRMIDAFDALVTGDSEKAQQIAQSRQSPPAKLFPDYFKVARLIGCDRNAAAISANQAVLKKTGENILALLGHDAIESEKQELVFNVSDLVDGISGQRMNKMLEAAGLQHKEGDKWVPDDGGKYSRIFDTGKRRGDGMPVQTVKWSRSALSVLTLEAA